MWFLWHGFCAVIPVLSRVKDVVTYIFIHFCCCCCWIWYILHGSDTSVRGNPSHTAKYHIHASILKWSVCSMIVWKVFHWMLCTKCSFIQVCYDNANTMILLLWAPCKTTFLLGVCILSCNEWACQCSPGQTGQPKCHSTPPQYPLRFQVHSHDIDCIPQGKCPRSFSGTKQLLSVQLNWLKSLYVTSFFKRFGYWYHYIFVEYGIFSTHATDTFTTYMCDSLYLLISVFMSFILSWHELYITYKSYLGLCNAINVCVSEGPCFM